ncbi:MAG: addiction module protein [Bacteroidota bacterium]
MSIQAIKQEVSHLNKMEQKELLHYMIEVVAGADNDLSQTWKTEIDRRIAAYQRGEVKTLTRVEAMKYAFGR